MNDLNSILIDGTLTEDPVLTETDEHGTSCRMTLVTTRTTRDGTVHSTTVTVETRDKVARDCSEHLRRDRGVRIVGRLTEDNGKPVVQADHVEFRPFRKPTQAAEPAVAGS